LKACISKLSSTAKHINQKMNLSSYSSFYSSTLLLLILSQLLITFQSPSSSLFVSAKRGGGSTGGSSGGGGSSSSGSSSNFTRPPATLDPSVVATLPKSTPECKMAQLPISDVYNGTSWMNVLFKLQFDLDKRDSFSIQQQCSEYLNN
jgi:hypothetical protein